MNPLVTLFSDIVLVATLGVAIFYCLRLSRQFNQMQADRKVFNALIQSLNTASARAEAAIHALRDAAQGDGGLLQEKINKSTALADELEIMIEAGDSLADRLQDLAGKSSRAAAAVEAPEEAPPKVQEIQPRSRAEKELLEALKAKQKS